MSEIIDILAGNVLTLVMLLCLLAGLMVVNMILGAVMSATVGAFDKARFGRSVLKAFLIVLSMCIFYACLELLPYVLDRVGIDVPSDLVTTIEVLGVVVVSFTKYAKEIFDKLMVLFDVYEVDEEETDEHFVEE